MTICSSFSQFVITIMNSDDDLAASPFFVWPSNRKMNLALSGVDLATSVHENIPSTMVTPTTPVEFSP